MIAPMKKILMAARVADKEKVLTLIRNTELVHVEPVDVTTMSLPSGLADTIGRCNKAISIVGMIKTSQGTIAAPGAPSRIIKEVLEHSSRIPELKNQLSGLSKLLHQLMPWGDLNLDDIELLERSNINIYFLQADSKYINELDAISNFTYSVVDSSDKLAMLVIAASTEKADIPNGVIVLPKPEQSWSEVSEKIDAIKKEIEDSEKTLAELALRKDDLEKFMSELVNKKRFSEVETSVLTDENVFILQGWCPVDEIDNLEKAFSEASINVGLQFEDPIEGGTLPPTQLKNPAWVKPIEQLYDFMGILPSYNEPDTSALFMSTLTVFSAFMLADAGYGLLVVIAILIAYKPLTSKGVEKGVLQLILILFGGVTVYGVLTNTYFGEVAFKVNSFDANSANGSALLQGLCFLMGISHLTVAHVIKSKNKKHGLALLGELGWIIFLWAMYAVICNLVIGRDFIVPGSWAVPMFKISLPMILFFTEPSWNIFSSIGKGLGAILQNASACFSDIVSYIRLWAIGLAGGKVAVAFNAIGGMLPSIALKLPVWIVGHGVNIILGAIAILAHGVRLNLLEFSNHLELEWTGRKYDPFKEIK